MDFSKFKRDRKKIGGLLKTHQSKVIVTGECKVYIPKRFTEKDLVVITDTITILGVCGIVAGDSYSTMLCNALFTTQPSSSTIVTIEDVEYFEFKYEAGDVFVTDINLVQDKQLIYKIFDEIVAKGKTPWYLTYEDLGVLFDTSVKHGALDLKTDHSILEMITASRARQLTDRTKYYRQTLNSLKDYEKKPAIIPLRSVMYGATNTTAKLMGSRLNEGISSALVNPSERNEDIESILRGVRIEKDE